MVDVHNMAHAIIRSVLSIVSMISSSILLCMILRSRTRLTTTQHRILLGMSVADILYSMSLATFNFMAPKDDSYFIWNAKGSQATCSAQGFILFIGCASGLIYNCSLNIYYLSVVKYQKSDKYIREKIEPFLHGIPVVYALVISITLLAKQNLNNAGGGTCYDAIYNPPHCDGYEDGEIPEGFEIPCGRGRDGAVLFYYVALFVTLFIVPIIVGVSLAMIYRAVSKQERSIARYGATAFMNSAQQTNASDISGSAKRGSIVRTVRVSLSSTRRASTSSTVSGPMHQTSPSQQNSKSRIVLKRALGYSLAYFLAWTFMLIGFGLNIPGIKWPTWLGYLTSIFNPLQGSFNFLIYMYPHVAKAKHTQGETISWGWAFIEAFWSRVSGGRNRKSKATKNTQDSNGSVKRSEGKRKLFGGQKEPNAQEQDNSSPV